MKRPIAIALVLASTALGFAQTPAEHNQHHPQGAAPAQPAVPQAQPGRGGQGMGMMQGGAHGMMAMMRDMPMMHMMQMMRQMGMMGSGSSGMAMVDRVEGRIAFLRAELKITDAQTSAWNGFAEALRANARKLADVRAGAMGQQSGGQTLAQRLDAQEQWLGARLEGTRALKAALAPLWTALSDEQKKSADELLAPHMGMTMMAGMPGGMPRMQGGPMQPGQGGMMPGQMMPGQMMPGQMMPGQMMPGQTQPGPMMPQPPSR
jgi:hypothetical protein